MATLRIPLNDGTSIPFLAYGSGTALFSKDASQGVADAIRAGFRHIDTAQGYDNEDSVGEGIQAAGVPRSELYITTKLSSAVPVGKTAKDVLLDSLRKLKTDYVDLYLIHSPRDHADIKKVWKELEVIKAEGLAKSIGVSNFLIKHFEEILPDATIVPAVNQIEIHPYVLKSIDPLLAFQKKHNILATSYGGLSPIVRFSGGPLDSVLEKIAKRLGEKAGVAYTPGQVLQLWLLKKKIPAITTSSKQERLKEYLAIAPANASGVLTDEESATIEGSLPAILTDEESYELDQIGSTVHHRRFQTWIDKEL